MTQEQESMEQAPESSMQQPGKRLISHTTLVAAIVVLAAVAMLIIWANLG